jgi:hypothetical protein
VRLAICVKYLSVLWSRILIAAATVAGSECVHFEGDIQLVAKFNKDNQLLNGFSKAAGH